MFSRASFLLDFKAFLISRFVRGVVCSLLFVYACGWPCASNMCFENSVKKDGEELP